MVARILMRDKDDKISLLTNHQRRPPSHSYPAAQDRVIEFASAAPCVVYECGSDLSLKTISANVVELIGIQPENIIGKCLLSEERILPQDCARLRDRIDQLKSQDVASLVHTIFDDQGLPVWVAHSLRRLQSGCESTFVGGMTPLPREFIATKLDAAIISQFVHKIGNHFQLINLMIGSLKKDSDEVGALQQTIDRAVEFTRSFSHFSQPPICATAVNIGDVLGSAIKSVASVSSEKNVFLQNVQESSPLNGALVSGDAFLLELALEAILHNALEATNSRGQILIDGAVETESRSGRTIARIVVADTGVGMEVNMATKVADPFVTSKSDRDGLGLSTAVRVIEAHGGTLKVMSAPGQGTSVQVVLPMTHISQQTWE